MDLLVAKQNIFVRQSTHPFLGFTSWDKSLDSFKIFIVTRFHPASGVWMFAHFTQIDDLLQTDEFILIHNFFYSFYNNIIFTKIEYYPASWHLKPDAVLPLTAAKCSTSVGSITRSCQSVGRSVGRSAQISNWWFDSDLEVNLCFWHILLLLWFVTISLC